MSAKITSRITAWNYVLTPAFRRNGVLGVPEKWSRMKGKLGVGGKGRIALGIGLILKK